MKPIGLMSYPIRNSTMTNGIVLDPFLGSGSNFNTPFVEVLPNNNTGTRNMSILRLITLTAVKDLTIKHV